MWAVLGVIQVHLENWRARSLTNVAAITIMPRVVFFTPQSAPFDEHFPEPLPSIEEGPCKTIQRNWNYIRTRRHFERIIHTVGSATHWNENHLSVSPGEKSMDAQTGSRSFGLARSERSSCSCRQLVRLKVFLKYLVLTPSNSATCVHTALTTFEHSWFSCLKNY